MEQDTSRMRESRFGVLVDFMSHSEVKLESLSNKTMQGVFIGYDVYA